MNSIRDIKVPHRAAMLGLAAWLLSACAGHAVKPPAQAALTCDGTQPSSDPAGACAQALGGLAAASAAEAASAAAGHGWTMQGRAAISTGKQAGNTRVEWTQPAGDRYSVTLSAPITRQSWRLDVAPGQATITGLEGGPRTGPDAALLLREATGWDIPVASMRHWLRGIPAPESEPSQYRFDAAHRLVGLDQDGWRIDFTRGKRLPTGIDARRGDSRVRLVIDQWTDDADAD